MKSIKYLLIILVFLPLASWGQRFYGTSDFNLIFSAGIMERGGEQLKTPVRFAPFFNYGYHANYDLSPHFGLITGIDLKNVGVIVKDTITTKHRAYSVGLNLALKVGNMTEKFYFFTGGSYEYLFAYKEKLFTGNEKIKRRGDFYRNDVNQFLPALFAGINMKGVTFKVQYYLDDFFSENYRFRNTNGYEYQPYTSSRLILFMIGYRKNLSDNKKKTQTPPIIPTASN
jgi:hypothetical protein